MDGRPDDVTQILLAEYAALRAEAERRTTIQWNVVALQLASAGAITSLAIAAAANVALLLIVPLMSYMLGNRYILHDVHLKLIRRYPGLVEPSVVGPSAVGGVAGSKTGSRCRPAAMVHRDWMERAASHQARLPGSISGNLNRPLMTETVSGVDHAEVTGLRYSRLLSVALSAPHIGWPVVALSCQGAGCDAIISSRT